MKTLQVKLPGRSYNIDIGLNILQKEISNFVSEIALLGNVTKTSTLFVLKTYKEYGVNFNTTFQKTRLSICP